MTAYESKIVDYLSRLSPELFGMDTIDSIKIVNMCQGSYNLNFHVRINHTDYNFRINIDQQSGLADQIKYEYDVLKFIDGQDIAPRAFLFDDQCQFFDFAIMIQEFFEGRYLTLSDQDVFSAAVLLSKLHRLSPVQRTFIEWKDPLPDTYRFVENDISAYASIKSHDKQLLHLARKTLARVKPGIDAQRKLFQTESLIHTDVSQDNFIMTSRGLRLIDWEKPRLDDGTYDICCFMCEPAELWCGKQVLNAAQRDTFVETYASKSGKDLSLLQEKVSIREPLVALHWILWGATKLCDLKEATTTPELLQAHEEKIERYERIADPVLIEKILDGMGHPIHHTRIGPRQNQQHKIGEVK